mmetsp:Transcript_60342/g.111937  ORF Transcript_60342/g.111937 Transcript_60342/m.111937 type:complete len:256 (-) Transcript_60342:106-873(-)
MIQLPQIAHLAFKLLLGKVHSSCLLHGLDCASSSSFQAFCLKHLAVCALSQPISKLVVAVRVCSLFRGLKLCAERVGDVCIYVPEVPPHNSVEPLSRQVLEFSRSDPYVVAQMVHRARDAEHFVNLPCKRRAFLKLDDFVPISVGGGVRLKPLCNQLFQVPLRIRVGEQCAQVAQLFCFWPSWGAKAEPLFGWRQPSWCPAVLVGINHHVARLCINGSDDGWHPSFKGLAPIVDLCALNQAHREHVNAMKVARDR